MFGRISLKFILSIILAGLIAWFTNDYLQSLKQTTQVVIAKVDIPEFTKITQDKLEVITVDKLTIDKIAPHALKSMGNLEGAITRVHLPKGKILTLNPQDIVYGEKKIDAMRKDGSIDAAYFIPYEKRAITIGLDADGALNNRLKIGDWVDVIFTSMDDSTGGIYSAFIAQHIEVFDIQDVDFKDSVLGKQGVIQQVTLLVTPQEAVDIALVKRKGVVDLVLNPLAGETVILPPSSPLKFTKKPIEVKKK